MPAIPLLAFNRGLVSPLALARVDVSRMALSAQTMTNWMPRTLGAMTLRPGLQYLGSTDSDNQAVFIDFVFSTDDTALVEVTNQKVRVWVSDTVIQRASVSSAVSNGTFDSNLTGWTDADESGATSAWETGGYMALTGTKFNKAIRRQQVTVATADQGTKHALKIDVERGPVTFKVGSTAGDDDYISETSLDTGEHSLSFTPTDDFHIELSSKKQHKVLVDSVAVEGSGDMSLTAPWPTADLSKIRWDQSGDILFVACDGYQQYKIERRATESWSVVKYETEDGPYRVQNVSSTTIAASALTGDVTLTASDNVFESSHVGALFKLESVGQAVEVDANGEGQWSSYIRVIGVDNSRVFEVKRLGTWSATVTLQRSIDEPGSWADVTTYTGNATVNYDDGLDNQIVYYRIGIDTGDYTSGTAELTLTYSGGGIAGHTRITAVASATSASALVLSDLGGTAATSDWSEGVWSSFRGWPTAVRFYEGRLGWFGKNWSVLSVSDSFYSFDEDVEGDSGPIVRTIGFGPVDTINWAMDLSRLMIGAEGSEIAARSTSFNEPLTPTNFNLKDASTQGSLNAAAVKVDDRAIYIQKSGLRVYELAYGFEADNHASLDLTVLYPDLGSPGFTKLAVQRQPDTRIHALRSDGTVAVLVYLPAEDVRGWVNFSTDGTVEDIVVLPGTNEDAVYYVVNRTINGSSVRFLEKWALESECIGGTTNKQADSFKVYSGTATKSITGLGHLEGEDVVVWADGKDVGTTSSRTQTYTVSSGAITLAAAASNVVVGLAYNAVFQNAKFAFQPLERVLTNRMRVRAIGLIMSNTHYQGLRYGPDADNLDELPLVEDHAEIDADTVHATYDHDAFTFNDTMTTDPRVYLRADAPRPCTILAAVPRLAL